VSTKPGQLHTSEILAVVEGLEAKLEAMTMRVAQEAHDREAEAEFIESGAVERQQ
jgi:hypothetical protein